MINRLTMAVYNHSPVWVQNLMCTQAGRRYQKTRYGPEFDRWAAFYAESCSWTEQQLKEYQREQLGLLISECYEYVPHYGEKWRRLGLSPQAIRAVEDLAKFPITTKDEVFQFGERMVSLRFRRSRLVEGMTGGSTGMPLRRFFTPGELQRHYAIFWDRMRPGVTRKDPYAAFQGKEIVPARQSGPPYWRENRVAKQRLYSMRHLAPAKLRAYADSLSDTPFVYYQGYASIMMVVAEYMAEHGLKLQKPPKALFSTSEELTPYARRLFEKTWETRVWDEYCQGERCALIQECDEGHYHVQMDYGIVEFEPIGKEKGLQLAEIICTGFIPHAAPLIRYRVGDRVLIDENAKCAIGRPGPVIKSIRGRTSDYIVTPDGRKYPHISLIVDLLTNVRKTQVVQDHPEEITVRVVPFPQYNDQDEQHLIRCFKGRIGGGIGVKVEHVSDLERHPNGKVLSIISRLTGYERGPAERRNAR